MLLPKPQSHRAERRAKRRHRADVIRATYEIVSHRDRFTCRLCGATGRVEMHEVTSRALLRGKPPEEIYSSYNCLMVCGPASDLRTCHGKLTARRIDVVFTDDDRGCDGPVEAQRRIAWTG